MKLRIKTYKQEDKGQHIISAKGIRPESYYLLNCTSSLGSVCSLIWRSAFKGGCGKV